MKETYKRGKIGKRYISRQAEREATQVKLSKLLENVEYSLVQGNLELEITDIKYNSKEVQTGDLFVAIKGAVVDSHKFIPDAIERGAAAIIIESDVSVQEGIVAIRVSSSREALAYLSATYWGNPAKRLTTIGITGTCGKTSTAYMMKAMLEKAGKKVGLIGSIEAVIDGEVFSVKNTTPESYEIHKFFNQMVEKNCDVAIMEVSSQGLKLDRVAGIKYDYGIFTNLSRDHIGDREHKDFEEYMQCKAKLFSQCKVGIVNADDPYYKEITKEAKCELIKFGMGAGVLDVKISNVQNIIAGNFLGTEFDVSGKIEARFRISIPGTFSIFNALCAVVVCNELGIDIESMKKALAKVQVKGRMQVVSANEKYKLIIDFAHNERECDSLKETIRSYNPKRVVCVIGSGGERSRDRRYASGKMASELAGLTIFTADNPRFEDIDNIMKDLVEGLNQAGGGEYVVINDREEAIRYAIENAQQGDYILLIGKGHETYQEIRGVKHPFDESEIVVKVEQEKGIR